VSKALFEILGAATIRISILGITLGLIVFAWVRGWKGWALIPGGICVLLRLLTMRMASDSPYLMSDTVVLLFTGQFLCICVLGIMAIKGRYFVDDE